MQKWAAFPPTSRRASLLAATAVACITRSKAGILGCHVMSVADFSNNVATVGGAVRNPFAVTQFPVHRRSEHIAVVTDDQLSFRNSASTQLSFGGRRQGQHQTESQEEKIHFCGSRHGASLLFAVLYHWLELTSSTVDSKSESTNQYTMMNALQ